VLSFTCFLFYLGLFYFWRAILSDEFRRTENEVPVLYFNVICISSDGGKL
jgi:hypothetical protein